MADRLAENGAVKAGQESTATVGTVSRLAGAGQIEAEIRRLVAEGFYTAKVAAYTVKGRLINAALDAIPPFIPFSPLSLFSTGEPGAWYDPSDYTTMYQDAAGTTPVTAVEQPVGLILDKRTGSTTLGTELVTNNTFDTDTVWTKGTGWTIGSGVATKTAGTASVLSQAISLTAGKTYRVVYTITRSAGTVTPRFTGGTTVTGTARNAAGTYVDFLTALTGNTTLEFSADASFAGTVDNVYVKEVTGNDACQPTSASRPTLKALYNLLTNTDTLATQNVTVTAGNHTLYFTGAGDITLSGTATGTYAAGTHTITTTAGTLTLTVSGSVLTADLRVANDGVGLPAYQQVASSTDYDTTGFPPYLSFDGTDDHMFASPINLNTVTSDGLTRRNLLSFPTMFGESYWNKLDSTITANAAVAPNGTSTADKIVADATSGIKGAYVHSGQALSSQTVSVFVKAAEYGYATVSYFPSIVTVSRYAVTIDLASGLVTQEDGLISGYSNAVSSVGNGWYRVSITSTNLSTSSSLAVSGNPTGTPTIASGVPSFTGDGTSGIYIWGAQLEAGSTDTTFQNIGTDEALIVAGQRKLKDGSNGTLIASTSSSATSGNFILYCPSTSNSYRLSNKGSAAAVNAGTGTFATSPHTGVVTGVASISGDLCRLRLNGSTIQTTTTDQGTGNYAASSQFYIGRQGTSASYFQGRMYNLVIRMAASTDTQISDTETYVNNLTKAY